MRVVSPLDTEYHNYAAAQLATLPDFWEDRMLVDPVATYMHVFASPNSYVVDLDGDGILAVVRDALKYKGFLYGASWGPKAKRIPLTRATFGTAALAAFDLLFIEGITKYDNHRARLAMEESGMTYRGRIVKGLWYNGQPTDGALYEFNRSQTGLDPLE